MDLHGIPWIPWIPWISIDVLKRRTVHGDLIRLVIRFTMDFFVDFRIRLDWVGLDWVGLGWIGKGTEILLKFY